MSARRLVAVSCVVFAVACLGAGLTALLPVGTRGVTYIAAHLLASAAMVVAWRSAEEDTAAWLLFVGIACRLALVPVPPYTTHDVTRYMFDGAVALSGLDPYLHFPGEPQLSSLRALWHPAIEHMKYPTIYPPLALWAFASCARFGPGAAWLVWKAIVGVASVVTLVVARRIATPPAFALLALSPILVLEGGIGGHLDVLCVMAVMLAVSETDPLARGTWIGVGILLKLTPVVLLAPLLVYALPAPWRALRMYAAAVAVVVAGYAMAAALGFHAVGSLLTFFAKWRFGSPWMLFTPPDQPWVVRVSGLVGVAVLGWSAWLAYRRRLGQALLLAGCAPFVASPVVFPWYLSTAAAMLALTPSPAVIAWMVGLPLTYEVIDRFDVDGSWVPASWPIAVTLVAVVVTTLWTQRKRPV